MGLHIRTPLGHFPTGSCRHTNGRAVQWPRHEVMHSVNPRPRADLLVTEVCSELIAYDGRTHQAHCLTPDAVKVWRLVDGSRSPDQIVADGTERLGLPAETTRQALEEFSERGLLQESPPALTRRDVMRSALKAGAVAPLVLTVLAPTAADASSGTTNNAGGTGGEETTDKGNNGHGNDEKKGDDGAPPGYVKNDKDEKDPPPYKP